MKRAAIVHQGRRAGRVKAGTSRAEAAKRRALFVEAYVTNGGNATQAAISAGFSPKTAKQQGQRLLTNVDLAAEVSRRRAETVQKAQEKTQLTADEVLASLARDLRFDPAKLLDDNGNLLPIREMDEDTRLALRGMEHYTEFGKSGEDKGAAIGSTAKVRFPEKTAAREQGMKHFGLYEADNSQKPAMDLPEGTKVVVLDFSKLEARMKAARR